MDTPTVEQNFSPKKEGVLHPEQIATTVIMTRVSEYFGFFVFAIGCALVFPQVFFPNYDPVIGTLISFGVFSLAFISSAFARMVFMPLEEKMGIGTRVTIAMFLLGGSTIFVAFIPGYEESGIVGPILLCLARIGQGLGSGGAAAGLPIIMMMNAPEHKKSWYAMIPQLGGPAGFAIAAAIYYVLTDYLTAEEFIDWGWRFPFMVVMALQVVALFTRLRLLDTPEYRSAVKDHALKASSVRKVLKVHWRSVILGAYLPLASLTLFHMVAIYPLGYIKLFPGVSVPDLLFMQTIGATLAILTCLISGILADRYDRRRFLAVITVVVGIFSSFIVALLGSSWEGFVLVGFCLLGLSFGQSGAMLPHRFEREYRYTGVAISNDLAWIFGAAFAPVIALSLTVWFGIEYAGYYLLSGAVASLIALYISRNVKTRTD